MEVMGICRLGIIWRNTKIDGVFYVAKTVFPSVIFGIKLIEALGFELKYQGDVNIIEDRLMNIPNMEICAIDPYISKNQYTEEKRLQNAKCKLKLQTGTKLYNCVDKFRNIFMAGKWDIGKRL